MTPARTASPATTEPPPAASGLSIASILGSSGMEPPVTTWTRVLEADAAFSYEVPATWTDHVSYPWVDGTETVGTVLAAGPSVAAIGTDFTIPGVAIGLSANPAGLTPRAAVEGDAEYGGVCTPGEVQAASEPTVNAAYQLWEDCDRGPGFLLVLAIVPIDESGLIAMVFQGTRTEDLGYLEHILGSLAERVPVSTSPPGPTSAPTPGSVAGQPYAISMTVCLNQHGQGVSEGLIRNDDRLIHVFRIEVWFFDLNGVLLNTTDWTTSEIPPGVTARWQAEVPSGLPAVDVQCQLREVEIVH